MFDDLQARIREEFNSTIKNFPGVKNYHVQTIKSTGGFSTKDKFLVRLWINEDEYDAYNIANILSGENDFKKQLQDIAEKIGAYVVFDIYR